METGIRQKQESLTSAASWAFGGRSYPVGMLVISTIGLMATPFLCFIEEYGMAVVGQVVAGVRHGGRWASGGGGILYLTVAIIVSYVWKNKSV